MKMLTRIAFLMVFVVALLVPGAALAQEDDCYGLSETNCALFTGIGSNEFNSFAMDFTFGLTVTGDDPVDASATGEGSFSLNPDAEDPLKSFNMAMTVTTTAEGEDVQIEFRIIDGVFYLTDPETGEWYFKEMQALIESGGMPFDPSMFTSDEAMGQMAGMEESMGQLGELIKSYYSVEYQGESMVADNTVAVFNAKFDIAGLLSDPQLSPAITEFLKASPELLGEMGMGDTSAMTEEEIEEAAQGMGMMVGMMAMIFQQTNLTYDVKVAPETGLFHGFTINFDMVIDPSMMGLGGGAEEEAPEPVEVTMNLDVNLWNHNAEFEYVAPEDPTELPDEMMGGMDMGM